MWDFYHQINVIFALNFTVFVGAVLVLVALFVFAGFVYHSRRDSGGTPKPLVNLQSWSLAIMKHSSNSVLFDKKIDVFERHL